MLFLVIAFSLFGKKKDKKPESSYEYSKYVFVSPTPDFTPEPRYAEGEFADDEFIAPPVQHFIELTPEWVPTPEIEHEL